MLVIKNIIPSLSVQVSESNHQLTDDTSFFLLSLQFIHHETLRKFPCLLEHMNNSRAFHKYICLKRCGKHFDLPLQHDVVIYECVGL